MANSFGTMPIYLDTDTTLIGGTNWKGASGGSSFTGGIGIRPEKIVIQPADSGTPYSIGNIVISDPNSSDAYFTYVIADTAQVPVEIDLTGAAPGWHDFIVTGLTSAAASLQIYYRP